MQPESSLAVVDPDAADGLRGEDGQTPMVATASVLGFLSAGIFLAHALEAYRTQNQPDDADLGSPDPDLV